MRALVVGRFQPFHLGHLELVRHALTRADEVVVAVGSAEQSHAPDNPFTAGERVEMILATLRAERLAERCVVVPVPDVHRNSLWVAHVRSLVPAFDLVLTNNPLPRILFEQAGFRVEGFPLWKREECEGTRLRASMREGGAWERAVPKAVAEVVRRVDGPGRLRALACSDAASVGQA